MSTVTESNSTLRRLASFVIAVLLATGLWVYRGPVVEWFKVTPDGVPSAAAPPRALAGAVDGGAPDAADDIDYWTCTMHLSVHQNAPGNCPICGMKLVPVTRSRQLDAVVIIDEARRQLIGVRTAPVTAGPMRTTFRALGHVAYDESGFVDVSLKVRGWITRLYVDRTGARVARGQPLFTLYSPELYGAQQDFLLANQAAAADPATEGSARVSPLARAARQRLKLLGLGDAQIDQVAAKGVPDENIPFVAPASGFVIEKDVVEGASVEAGMRLFRLAALDKVWVEADVYEADLAHVRVGQHVDVTLDYLPGQSYDARVASIYPYLDPRTRTGRVRMELANKQLELRPGMYANVVLAADLGDRVQVPADAVVYTGPRRLVFVDLGQGRFRPQEVQVGTEAGGAYEVLSGLKAGDLVATSGVFLIAAEARISGASKYWESGDADAGTAPKVLYTCPMHPQVQSPTPGKCPICGMTLVRKVGDSR